MTDIFPIGGREGAFTTGHGVKFTASGDIADTGEVPGSGTVDIGTVAAAAFYPGATKEVAPSQTVQFLEAAHAVLLKNTFVSLRFEDPGVAVNLGGLGWFISNGDGSWSWAFNTAVGGDFSSLNTFATIKSTGAWDFLALTVGGAATMGVNTLSLPSGGFIGDNGVAPTGTAGSGYVRKTQPTINNPIVGAPVVFASLPGSPTRGMLAIVTDSNTGTAGATVAGGGSTNVLACYSSASSAWKVVVALG